MITYLHDYCFKRDMIIEQCVYVYMIQVQKEMNIALIVIWMNMIVKNKHCFTHMIEMRKGGCKREYYCDFVILLNLMIIKIKYSTGYKKTSRILLSFSGVLHIC